MISEPISRRSALKTLGIASGFAALGLPLAACGNSDGPSGGSPGGTFSMLTDWDTDAEKPLRDVAENWGKKAGRTVDVQVAPASGYDAKLRTVLASGSAPEAVRINDDLVRGYYNEGTLLDLRPYMEKDKAELDPSKFYPVIFDFPRQPDGAYPAWPIGTSVSLLYCNIDAFKEAGVPLPPKEWTAASDGWSWDDFLEAAQKLTKPNGERWGIITVPDTSGETYWTVNNGSEGIYSKDGTQFTFADKAATDGIQWAADLALVHKVHPDFATTKAGSATPNWKMSLFANGQAAMVTSQIGQEPYLRQNAKINWDVFPLPARVERKTINTMTVLAIPRDSKDPDGAWDMLKYFLTDEAGTTLSEFLMPVSRSAAKAYVESKSGQAPANLQLVLTALDHAVNENFNPYIEQARTVYRPLLDDVWSGKQTAAEAMGSVKAQVEEILAGKK